MHEAMPSMLIRRAIFRTREPPICWSIVTTTLERAQLQQELDTGAFTALGFGFGMQSAVVSTIF